MSSQSSDQKKCDVLLGGQWGDEGKAKITDFLAKEYDIICRYQGGSNAGHTVVYQNRKYVFHLVPSGLLNPNIAAVLGHGMVIHLPQLVKEIQELNQDGISLNGRLLISDQAFIVTDYHLEMDRVKEIYDQKIGTTIRGIGPAYTDKFAREGIRVSDLFHSENLLTKIKAACEIKKSLLEHYYHHENTLNPQAITDKLLQDFTMIRPYVVNTIYYLNNALPEKNILLEGAQGTGLDIDYGSYPYVTSSSPTSGGAATGSGIAPNRFQQIIGIFKAYVTRVGEGHLVTQIHGDLEESLRQKGGEFGATTGRSRGCGWFDGVHARYSVMVNGINAIALTKLDTLTGFDSVKICTHYNIDEENSDQFPSTTQKLSQVRPVYQEFPGWDGRVAQVKKLSDLHPHARKFVDFIEEYLGVPIKYISTGPDREDTISL